MDACSRESSTVGVLLAGRFLQGYRLNIRRGFVSTTLKVVVAFVATHVIVTYNPLTALFTTMSTRSSSMPNNSGRDSVQVQYGHREEHFCGEDYLHAVTGVLLLIVILLLAFGYGIFLAVSPRSIPEPTCPATSANCDGVIYQGICLKVATTRGWRDVPPVNCFPYHPARSWTLLNYVGICKETLGKASCRLGSTRIPGSSKCLNHRAVVIFGYDADLPWVNGGSFGWMPTPDCQRYSEQSNTTLTKVYACYHNCSSTAGQPQMEKSVNNPPTATPAPPSLVYDGIYLQAVVAKSPVDDSIIPRTCHPYKPFRKWTVFDYVRICSHFTENRTQSSSPTVRCLNYDSDREGGACVNGPAVLAFENNNRPDVWVDRRAFSWNPSPSSSPPSTCELVPHPPGTVVFACGNHIVPPSAPRLAAYQPRTSTPVPGCHGYMYDGVCLHARQSFYLSQPLSGCTPYQPARSWTSLDYLVICRHFGGTCLNYDTDADGGRCSNNAAVLAFENNAFPDVWVNRATFRWRPSTGVPTCDFTPGRLTVVFACSPVAAEDHTQSILSTPTVETSATNHHEVASSSSMNKISQPGMVLATTTPAVPSTSRGPILTTTSGIIPTTSWVCPLCSYQTLCCDTQCLCPFGITGTTCHEKSDAGGLPRFYGNSFMAFEQTYTGYAPLVGNSVRIEFTTKHSDMLILSWTGQVNFYAVGINSSGHLVYLYDQGYGEETLTSNVRVDDGLPHVATIISHLSSVEMTIDMLHNTTLLASANLLEFNVDPSVSIYLGGMDLGEAQCKVQQDYRVGSAMFRRGFVGCIASFGDEFTQENLNSPASGANIGIC